MTEFFANLSMPTMVVMVAAQYVALSLVLVSALATRRTYPGFGLIAASQIVWTFGIFLNYFRIFGELLSLFAGNALMLGHTALLFHGLGRYGDAPHLARRSALNVALLTAVVLLLAYYLFVDFNTCRRVTLFSAGFGILFLRIALEPYLCRQWRVYATQNVFSSFYVLVGVVMLVRAYKSLSATDCVPGSPDDLAKMLLLAAMAVSPLATFCLLAMTSSRIEGELVEAREQARQLAETDSLTDLPCRRHFLELAVEAMADAASRGEPLSLVMLDIDNFKDVNDTHGHQTGDMVLMAVAGCMRKRLRGRDVAGRLGGEEFGILMPGRAIAEACAEAERLRRDIENLHPDGLTVTASLGAACDGGSLDALLAQADECLYFAKRAGRNRVACRVSAACAPELVDKEKRT